MSEPRPQRETVDPPQMSLAEKLACEWEARHDVAARGRVVHAAPVQHYLEHNRCEDNRHPRPAARAQQEPAAEDNRPAITLGLRGWWRSLR